MGLDGTGDGVGKHGQWKAQHVEQRHRGEGRRGRQLPVEGAVHGEGGQGSQNGGRGPHGTADDVQNLIFAQLLQFLLSDVI